MRASGLNVHKAASPKRETFTQFWYGDMCAVTSLCLKSRTFQYKFVQMTFWTDRQTMRQQIVTERVFAEWRFLVQSGLADSVNGIRLFLFSHYAIFARKTLE